ncbi:MAG: carboxylesterase family protein, partial [Pseudomonadota bacterium]
MVDIKTALGPVKGTEVDGTPAFLAIPYAMPPVGERRWRAPSAVQSWTSLDATQYGNRCLQTPYADVLAGFELHG